MFPVCVTFPPIVPPEDISVLVIVTSNSSSTAPESVSVKSISIPVPSTSLTYLPLVISTAVVSPSRRYHE